MFVSSPHLQWSSFLPLLAIPPAPLRHCLNILLSFHSQTYWENTLSFLLPHLPPTPQSSSGQPLPPHSSQTALNKVPRDLCLTKSKDTFSLLPHSNLQKHLTHSTVLSCTTSSLGFHNTELSTFFSLLFLLSFLLGMFFFCLFLTSVISKLRGAYKLSGLLVKMQIRCSAPPYTYLHCT